MQILRYWEESRNFEVDFCILWCCVDVMHKFRRCLCWFVRAAVAATSTGPRLLARDCCDAVIAPTRAKRIMLRASGYTQSL